MSFVTFSLTIAKTATKKEKMTDSITTFTVSVKFVCERHY